MESLIRFLTSESWNYHGNPDPSAEEIREAFAHRRSSHHPLTRPEIPDRVAAGPCESEFHPRKKRRESPGVISQSLFPYSTTHRVPSPPRGFQIASTFMYLGFANSTKSLRIRLVACS